MSESCNIDNPERTAVKLWQDYLFLSREMLKFLEKQEYDLFLELISQREKVQELLEKATADGFTQTEQGQLLLAQIRELDISITQKVQLFLNHARQKHSVSKAYDGYGETWGAAGNRLDQTIR